MTSNENINFNNLLSLENININLRLNDLGFILFKIVEKSGKYKVRLISKLPERKVVVPGSFNPIHKGHYLIGINALKEFQNKFQEDKNIIFELSATNFSKNSISNMNVKQRILYFLESYKNNNTNKTVLKKVSNNVNISKYTFYICITNAPLFVNKIDIFGNDTIYAIGADTFVRIIAPFPGLNEFNGLMQTLNGLKKLKDNKSILCVFDRPSINIKNNVVITNVKIIKGKFKEIIEGQLLIIDEILKKLNEVQLKKIYILLSDISPNISLNNISLNNISPNNILFLIKILIKILIENVSIKYSMPFNMNFASSKLRDKLKLPKYFNKGTKVSWINNNNSKAIGTVIEKNANSNIGSHKYKIQKMGNNTRILSILSHNLSKE